jgi:polyisoprenyl-teichoic acid--peptidoglycan teichoic acid transferase
MTQFSPNNRPQNGVRLPLWGLGVITLLLTLTLLGSAFWLFRTVKAVASEWQVTQPDFGSVNQPQPPLIVDGVEVTPTLPLPSSPNVPPIVSAEAFKPWARTERVTALFLGIDQRCDDDGPTRTDSIMLLTLDPVGKTAAALSIPRDLWVEIPGFGVDRVNQAHYIGEIRNYPGGGPRLALETVEALVGVKIDYYVTVNFDAFIGFVDLIGGIEIDVPETIDDRLYPDSCYGYEPFYIEAGRQQLDGETALKYARTRATYYGDVDRAGRQQQVVLAARERVLRLDMIAKLTPRAGELWFSFQNNVRTNLTLDEAVQLIMLSQDIPQERIRTEVLDYNYVFNETTPAGQSVLIPRRNEIRDLRDLLFAPPAIPTPVIENLPELALAENARIAIYNGTQTFGLAAKTEDYLTEYGFNIVAVGNADSSSYRTTQIIDYGSYYNTARCLTQVLSVPPLNISSGSQPDGEFDILIILGADWGRIIDPG